MKKYLLLSLALSLSTFTALPASAMFQNSDPDDDAVTRASEPVHDVPEPLSPRTQRHHEALEIAQSIPSIAQYRHHKNLFPDIQPSEEFNRILREHLRDPAMLSFADARTYLEAENLLLQRAADLLTNLRRSEDSHFDAKAAVSKLQAACARKLYRIRVLSHNIRKQSQEIGAIVATMPGLLEDLNQLQALHKEDSVTLDGVARASGFGMIWNVENANLAAPLPIATVLLMGAYFPPSIYEEDLSQNSYYQEMYRLLGDGLPPSARSEAPSTDPNHHTILNLLAKIGGAVHQNSSMISILTYLRPDYLALNGEILSTQDLTQHLETIRNCVEEAVDLYRRAELFHVRVLAEYINAPTPRDREEFFYILTAQKPWLADALNAMPAAFLDTPETQDVGGNGATSSSTTATEPSSTAPAAAAAAASSPAHDAFLSELFSGFTLDAPVLSAHTKQRQTYRALASALFDMGQKTRKLPSSGWDDGITGTMLQEMFGRVIRGLDASILPILKDDVTRKIKEAKKALKEKGASAATTTDKTEQPYQ